MQPQFSRSKFKFKKDIRSLDINGEPVEYRGVAFLQFRTEWNEKTRSFTPMTPEQKQICGDLHRQLADAGVELGVTVSERVPGEEDVRAFPKVMQFQLMVNEPRGEAPVRQAPPGPAPAAVGSANNGW